MGLEGRKKSKAVISETTRGQVALSLSKHTEKLCFTFCSFSWSLQSLRKDKLPWENLPFELLPAILNLLWHVLCDSHGRRSLQGLKPKSGMEKKGMEWYQGEGATWPVSLPGVVLVLLCVLAGPLCLCFHMQKSEISNSLVLWNSLIHLLEGVQRAPANPLPWG